MDPEGLRGTWLDLELSGERDARNFLLVPDQIRRTYSIHQSRSRSLAHRGDDTLDAWGVAILAGDRLSISIASTIRCASLARG